jgi:hypothetical protein
LLELHALRLRQLRTAFLHGRRRTWRDRHPIWPAIAVAVLIIALLTAGGSVLTAFRQQQDLDSRTPATVSLGRVGPSSTHEILAPTTLSVIRQKT